MTEIRWHHYVGVLLLSVATLLLELALTRVLSVANWYHFGFLVVSTALLGFGVAGVTLSLWTKLRREALLDRSLTILALLFSLATLGGFGLMQEIPFRPFHLLLERSQWAYGPLYYVVLAAPFFFSGLAISLLLSRGGRKVHGLYAADLLGAGLGAAAVCGVMPAFGGSGSVVVAAMVGALAALIFSDVGSFQPSKLTLFCGLAVVGLLALAFAAERVLPITVLPEKHHSLEPADDRPPIFTKWNTFSRIDVYALPAAPEQGRPDAGFSIVIDAGAAATAIPDLSTGVRNYLASAREYQPGCLAYIGKEHPKVLIIGSGAGREILEALACGATSVTAVEINPIINDIVTKRMRARWGGLFEQPEVRLVTEDGRSFVRRSREKYDAIISIQTMSDAAFAAGALLLSESYLLTQEAFEEYWNHLTPVGTLLITRPAYQIPKLFATTRELFEHLGLGSPAEHVLAFRGTVTPFGHRQFLTGFLLQKSPLGSEEVAVMAERLGVGRKEQWGDTGQPEIYYSPFHGRSQAAGLQHLLVELMTAPDVDRVYASSSELLQPATDDRPFFNQRTRWSSLRPYMVRAVLEAGERGDVDRQPVAQVALIVLLIQAALVAGVMIFLPLLWLNPLGLRVAGRWAFLTYFACLGSGFILIEIVLLQRFSVFLGQPVYSLSVVLASLLGFTGAGSYLASRAQAASQQKLSWLLVAVVGAILGTALLTEPILSLTLGLRLGWRVAVTVALIAPLGMLLGVPFPTGLRLVGEKSSALVPWAWAINSFFTVVGSVGAMILGMALGFTSVLSIAALCYAAALVAIRRSTSQSLVASQQPQWPES